MSIQTNLLFIYGGKGNQKGLFTNVTAVEAYNSVVYVLDSRKNSITTFKRTEFGNIVHEAMGLYNLGKYEEASGPWQEVLTRDHVEKVFGISGYMVEREDGEADFAIDFEKRIEN